MFVLEYLTIFAVGGIIYGGIELLYRRRTHWTMVLTGGLCFSLIYLISTRTDWPLLVLCLAGTAIITIVEFFVGCIVNIRLRWNVWDYSANRWNLRGQVCPLFMGCWFLLCFPGVGLANALNSLF